MYGSKKKTVGPESKFPGKLHDLLEYAQSQNLDAIISWVLDGKGFIIHDPAKLVHLLPMFFSQTQYRSFRRQLHHWHFKRINKGPHKGAFFHPYFVKGCRTLCRQMSRQVFYEPLPATAVLKSSTKRHSASTVESDLGVKNRKILELPPSSEISSRIQCDNVSPLQAQQRTPSNILESSINSFAWSNRLIPSSSGDAITDLGKVACEMIRVFDERNNGRAAANTTRRAPQPTNTCSDDCMDFDSPFASRNGRTVPSGSPSGSDLLAGLLEQEPEASLLDPIPIATPQVASVMSEPREGTTVSLLCANNDLLDISKPWEDEHHGLRATPSLEKLPEWSSTHQDKSKDVWDLKKKTIPMSRTTHDQIVPPSLFPCQPSNDSSKYCSR